MAMAKEQFLVVHVVVPAEELSWVSQSVSCKECDGTGRRRCDVCGGVGEVEPANAEKNIRGF